MDINVALSANRNDIEPVFGFIALVVMILFCLFSTRAFQGSGTWYFSSDNSVADFVFSHYFFREFSLMFGIASLLGRFTAFGLEISNMSELVNSLASFALAISLIIGLCFFFVGLIMCITPSTATQFAIISIAVFTAFAFVKLRQQFNLFASTTRFGYDLLRHSFFLSKKLCLELITAHTVVGSFYINSSRSRCQEKYYN